MQGMWIPRNFKDLSPSTQASNTWKAEVFCQECNSQFTANCSLKQHQQAIHKGKSTPAVWNVTTRQLPKVVYLNTSNQFIRERNTHGECEYHVTLRNSRVQHQQAIHEGKKYPCLEWEYKVNSKSHLAQHQGALHEGLKYTCSKCNSQFIKKTNKSRYFSFRFEILVENQELRLWFPPFFLGGGGVKIFTEILFFANIKIM